jgi:hypothetical protein
MFLPMIDSGPEGIQRAADAAANVRHAIFRLNEALTDAARIGIVVGLTLHEAENRNNKDYPPSRSVSCKLHLPI